MAGREYTSNFDWRISAEEKRRRDEIARGIVQDEMVAANESGNTQDAATLQREIANRFNKGAPVASPQSVSTTQIDTAGDVQGDSKSLATKPSDPFGWRPAGLGSSNSGQKQDETDPFRWRTVSATSFSLAPEPPPPPETFGGAMTRGFKKTWPELKQTAFGAAAFVADVFGADGIKEWGLHKAEDIEKETKPLQSPNDSFSDVVIDGNGSFKLWAGNAAGYTVGQALLALGTGGIGAVAGKTIAKKGITSLVEKELATRLEQNLAAGMTEEAAKAAAQKSSQELLQQSAIAARNLGAKVGVYGQTEVQEVGSVYRDRVEESKKTGEKIGAEELLKTFAWATAAAAVEGADTIFNAKKILEGTMGKSIARRAAVEVPLGAGRGAGTEFTQTLMEQQGAGKPVDFREAIDSAAIGAVGDAGAGAIGSLHSRTASTVPIDEAADAPITPVVTPDQIRALPSPNMPAGNGVMVQGPDGVRPQTFGEVTTAEQARRAADDAAAERARLGLGESQRIQATSAERQSQLAEQQAQQEQDRIAATPALPSPDMPSTNGVLVQDQSGLRPQTYGESVAVEQARIQADQVASERMQLGVDNVQRIPQAALDGITHAGPTPEPAPTLSSSGKPFATEKSALVSIQARGLKGAIAVPVMGGYGIQLKPRQLSAATPIAQGLAPQIATTQVPANMGVNPNPVAPQAIKPLSPYATLTQAIRKLGGLLYKTARDITGNAWHFANKQTGYKDLFTEKGSDLSTLVHDGRLDAFLPPNLRSDVRDDSRPTDTDEAIAYIENLLRTGEASQARSFAKVDAAQQRAIIANQKQQEVAPIGEGPSTDSINEAEYEHFKQTGESGFGWMGANPALSEVLDAATIEQIDAALNQPANTDERAGMRALGFTDEEITATLGPDTTASADAIAQPQEQSSANESPVAGGEAQPTGEVSAPQPSISREDAQTATRAARQAAHTEEQTGDVLLDSSPPSYLSMQETIDLAKKYLHPDDWARPYQLQRVLDVNSGDWNRVTAALAKENGKPETNLYDPEQAKPETPTSPLEAAAKALESAAVAVRAMAAPQKAQENDFLSELFGQPSDQPAEKSQPSKNKQREVEDIRSAIRSAIDAAVSARDDWSSRDYKANKKQVDLRGDGPSNQASMSVGSINESKRNKAVESLNQEIAALEKLEQQVSTDDGAARVLASMTEIMDTAKRSHESGNYPGSTVNGLFEALLLDRLNFRGPGGQGGITSNNLSKAVLSAIAPQERPALNLASQSEAEIRANEAKKAKAATDKLKADAAAESVRKQELDKADLRKRAQATVDDFQLGDDAMAQMAGQNTLFSRATEPAKLTKDEVTAAVRAINKVWPNAPTTIVLASMKEAPVAVQAEDMKQRRGGADGSPRGFVYDGKVYIVASEMGSIKDVAETMLHEIAGHYGLRRAFGAELTAILADVARLRNADVLAKAKQYGLDATVERNLMRAAEEVLAEMAETEPTAGLVRRAIAAIRKFLRQFPMFKDMKLSDNDIIVNYLIPARDSLRNGVDGKKFSGAPVFSRATNAGMAKPLSESKFESQYFQHIDVRGRSGGTQEQTLASIMRDGFKGQYLNALPVTRGTPPSDVVSRNYAPRAGDMVYLVPKDAIKNNKVQPGWTPQPYEAIRVTSDNPDMYAEYRRALEANDKPAAQATITVDGKERSRLNSNGKPIAATDDMFTDDFAGKRTKVDTGILADSKGNTIKGGNVNSDKAIVTFTKQGLSNFWDWFGTSVAVDVKNRPLVMYHSTNEDIRAFETGRESTNNYGLLGDFETSRAAIFVTPERGFSQEYLRDGDGKNVMQVYASLQNPIDLREGLSESDERALEDRGINTRYIHNIRNDWELFDNDNDGKNEFVDALKAIGFDGAIFYETGQDGERHKTYAVFSPQQLKSATGNKGTFSPDNADIRFSRTTTVGETQRKRTPEQERAFANLGRTTQEPTLKERAQALWQDAGKKLAQGVLDQFAPIKDLSKEAYGLLRLSKGASGAFEVLLRGGKLKLTDNVYDLDGKNDGGVVDNLLIPLQGEHHDFLWWIAANRAERLQSEGKENLFTPADITAMKSLADGDTAFDYTIKTGPNAGKVTRNRLQVYADSQRVFNDYNKNVLDLAEQSGMIDGAARKTWEHEFYVPFYRVADEGDGVRGMNVKSGVVRQQAFKELKGGKNALNADLLDNTLMNWAHLLDASAKNRAAKATIEAAEKMGIAATGDQATLQQMATSTKNKGGVVWFMDGGQKRYSLMDNTGDGPYVMAAINALEYAGMRGPIMTAMGTMKHALTVGVTASPFFKVRNLIRDSVQAIGTSGLSYNPATNLAQGWKLTDPKSDEYFRLLAGGGTIHFGTMMEGSEAKRIQALVESGVDDSTILNDENKVKAFYRKFIEPGVTAYNELGNRGEAVNRAALYDQLRKQMIYTKATASGVVTTDSKDVADQWKATGATVTTEHKFSHADAALQARDLMDFSLQGNFATIRFLTQVVPFMNARIQGLSKLGRSVKDDPKKFGVVLGAVGLISVGLLAAYGDDDDWKKREEWDRNNYWWFKIGGSAFRIPKPFEIGAIATLAERGFELAFDKEMTGERFRRQVVTLLGDNLSMNPTPQAIKPILEIYANKGFNDRPIETMGMEHLKSDYRFTDRTSMTARALSTAANSATDLIGVSAPSPVQIDHMLRGYFGWLGSFVVGAGDVLARPATGQATHAAPDLWKEATGGMVSDLRDAPSRYVSQLYDQAKTLEQAYGTWRALQKQGKTEEASDFFTANKDSLAKYRNVEHVKQMEAKLNERKRLIERSNLDPEIKREKLREIANQQSELAKTIAPS